MKRRLSTLTGLLLVLMLLASGEVSTALERRTSDRSGIAPLGSAIVSLPDVPATPGGQVIVPLNLDISGESLYAADFTIGYDSAVLTATGVTAGALAGNFMVASNLDIPGQVRVSMAGAQPITSSGELLRVAFDVVASYPGPSSDLIFTRAELNEGAIPTSTEDGRITVAIPLHLGWNLVSLPWHPDDTSAAAVLASIAGQYDIVYAYDAFDDTDPWKSYDPQGDPLQNDLTVIDETMGLWIRATEEALLSVPGSAPSSVGIPLKAGWNLIGYPSTQLKPIADALTSIEGKYTFVYAYDASDMTNRWKKYDPSAPPFVNDLTEMEPGRGYWIHVTLDATLTVTP